jgi:uncharacterized protein (DUF1810 family)
VVTRIVCSETMNGSSSRLSRFREAQASLHSGFASALAEIQSGRKRGHWIWYVFPQISGLGSSELSRKFAIENEDEAAAFLRDRALRSRLSTIANALVGQIKGDAALPLRTVMNSEIDARKVVSSLTLFRHVARTLCESESESSDVYGPIATVAEEILAIAASQGYPPCEHTLRRLRHGQQSSEHNRTGSGSIN